MTKFLNLVLSGAVTGAIYSIMASGLVLTYSTAGIFNFAHSAIAFSAAYLYYQLNPGQGLPIVPSVVIVALIYTPLLGLLLDRILLRRLAKAPVYARIVGTIGLLIALPNLMQWLVVTVGNDVLDLGLIGNEAQRNGLPVPGAGPTPAHVYHPLSHVALDSDQLAVFVVAALAAVALWLVLVLGLIIGRDRARKASSLATDLPRPDHRAGLPTWRKRLPWAIFTVCV